MKVVKKLGNKEVVVDLPEALAKKMLAAHDTYSLPKPPPKKDEGKK